MKIKMSNFKITHYACLPIAVTLFAALIIFLSANPVESKEQPATEKEISSMIMSPACPGYLLINCPSAEATQIRELIRQMVEKGDSKEKIMNYLAEIYGEGIRAEPPKKGFGLLAWILPFAALINGGIVVFLLTGLWLKNKESKKKDKEKIAPEVEDRFAQQLDEELKKHDF